MAAIVNKDKIKLNWAVYNKKGQFLIRLTAG